MVLAPFPASMAGCSDVGDSSALSGASDDGGSNVADAFSPQDASPANPSSDASQENASATGPTGDEMPVPLGGNAEAGNGNGAGGDEPEVTGGSGSDATVPGPPMDAMADVSSLVETGAPETGAVEADATLAMEAGGVDAAPEVSSEVDAEMEGSGSHDASEADSEAGGQSLDSGTTDGGQPTPCTMAPCAASGANSVKCTGSPSGVCTSTEAMFVSKDIAAGLLGATGQVTAQSCYNCLKTLNCLDNAFTSGEECGEVPTTFMPTGTSSGETAAHACLDVINCTIANQCATSNPDAECYCGTAMGTACNTMANGPCQDIEANGLGLMPSDGTTVNLDYTDIARPSGMANTIFACAFSNSCTACLP